MAETIEIVVEVGKRESGYWKDLWRFRELLYFLAWRDILVRYKQAVFGVAWALLRPLLAMLIFTFVFGKVAHLPSAGLPYSVFVLAAMLPWQLFSNTMTEAGSSLVINANMISKVYFPRLLVPASTLLVGLVDFGISLLFLGLLLAYFRVPVSFNILYLPFFLLLVMALSLAAGCWLAALTVRYRDFRYVVPFLVQVGMYVSPVGYSSQIVPARYLPWYALNPMVGLVEGMRWCLFGSPLPFLKAALLNSGLITVLLLASGLWYFRRTERNFADVI